jgi:primosomal protein N''
MSEIIISISLSNIQILKRLASEKSISLNDFLTQEIEKWADRELRYQQAKERQIALMKKGIDLGFQNDEPPSRDSLHER